MKAKTNGSTHSKPVPPISLADFLMAKKRAGCAICKLPVEARGAISEARKKRERQSDIIEWIAAAYKAKVTPQDFSSHTSGRHET